MSFTGTSGTWKVQHIVVSQNYLYVYSDSNNATNQCMISKLDKGGDLVWS